MIEQQNAHNSESASSDDLSLVEKYKAESSLYPIFDGIVDTLLQKDSLVEGIAKVGLNKINT